MNTVSLRAINITKTFNRRHVIIDVNCTVEQTRSLALVGRNGSGKSTLLKILAGLLSPSSGRVEVEIDRTIVKREDMYNSIGFVAPYLQLYDEFTAYENLTLFHLLRKNAREENLIEELLERVNLHHRRHDTVRTFSSGMKQRLKYIFALLHRPPILLLDEPTTNLDAEGIDFVYSVVREQQKNGIVIIASNDREDIELCDDVVDLNTPSPVRQGGGK